MQNQNTVTKKFEEIDWEDMSRRVQDTQCGSRNEYTTNHYFEFDENIHKAYLYEYRHNDALRIDPELLRYEIPNALYELIQLEKKNIKIKTQSDIKSSLGL